MGLEFICDRCRSPMCYFQYRARVYKNVGAVQQRVCVHCCHIENEAGNKVPEVVYRAIGVLTAQHRRYIMSARWRLMHGIFSNGIRDKAKALIRHDRILRGEH